MCTVAPGPLLRSQWAKILKTHLRLSSSRVAEEDTSDMYGMRMLWSRAPPRQVDQYPDDQKPFSISRKSEEKFQKYRKGLFLRKDSYNVILSKKENKGVEQLNDIIEYFKWLPLKFFVLGAEKELPELKDVVEGNRKIFRMILDCINKGNFDKLIPMTLGKNTLDFHRKAAFGLTSKQRFSLQVTDDDFVGKDGFLCNANGMSTYNGGIDRYIHWASVVPTDAAGGDLDRPHIVYSVMLIAVRKKNDVFKLVRSWPFNTSPDRMIVRMPLDYGFKAPRYVIMRIDLCHEVVQSIPFLPMKLAEDCLLYDFHVHSFS